LKRSGPVTKIRDGCQKYCDQIVTSLSYSSPTLILKDLGFRPFIRLFMVLQHAHF